MNILIAKPCSQTLPNFPLLVFFIHTWGEPGNKGTNYSMFLATAYT